MQISVSFPFQTALPYTWSSDILLKVSTLAPMVSSTLIHVGLRVAASPQRWEELAKL